MALTEFHWSGRWHGGDTCAEEQPATLILSPWPPHYSCERLAVRARRCRSRGAGMRRFVHFPGTAGSALARQVSNQGKQLEASLRLCAAGAGVSPGPRASRGLCLGNVVRRRTRRGARGLDPLRTLCAAGSRRISRRQMKNESSVSATLPSSRTPSSGCLLRPPGRFAFRAGAGAGFRPRPIALASSLRITAYFGASIG